MVEETERIMRSIQAVDSVKNWQEAVKLASQPLLEQRMIEQNYIDNMIKAVYEHGPYMVLCDGFALMHAKPGEGVNHAGMSLLVVREAVDFEGRFVKIFLILATTDYTSHLDSLKDIIEILMNKEHFETILTADVDSIKHIF